MEPRPVGAGHARREPIMALCNAPNPYPINGRCILAAGHPENIHHTNGHSEWTTESLARQAELDTDESDTIRPTGAFDAAEALRLRVEAAADQILKLVPDALAAMVARAERETAARRALGGIA